MPLKIFDEQIGELLVDTERYPNCDAGGGNIILSLAKKLGHALFLHLFLLIFLK